MIKAVVHINFEDHERQAGGLRNIANILDGAGNDSAIEVVCHGKGIGLLLEEQSAHTSQIAKLAGAGVSFLACRNTLESQSLPATALLAPVKVVPSGAIHVIERQQAGYAYFRP